MFSTQAFSFRNDGDGVELRFKLEGEIFLSYILSDPQLLWILYFLEQVTGLYDIIIERIYIL